MAIRMTDTPVTTEFNRGMSIAERDWKRKQVTELRKDLMKAIGVIDRHWFYRYRDGKMQMTVPQMFAVWQTFSRHGIADPWGARVEEAES